MRRDILFIEAAGEHREVGRQVGEAARELVHAGVEYYAGSFPVLGGMTFDEALARSQPYLAAADAWAPRSVDYLRGLAEGADLSFARLFAVNCVEEFTCRPELPAGPGREAGGGGAGSPAPPPPAEHCTSFAFVTGDRVVAGHNEDWYPGDIDSLVVRRIALPGVTTLSVGGAHSLPVTAISSHGICSAANTVYSWDMREGVPNNVILAGMHECATLEAAREHLASAPRARGSNHLLADARGRIWDVETTASRVAFIDGGDCFAHTNHYVDEELAAQDATTSVGTFGRRARALEMIGAGLAAGADPVALAQFVLRDHSGAPLSICAHWDAADPAQDQSVSTASMVWEPACGRLHVAVGQPCEHDYVTYTL